MLLNSPVRHDEGVSGRPGNMEVRGEDIGISPREKEVPRVVEYLNSMVVRVGHIDAPVRRYGIRRSVESAVFGPEFAPGQVENRRRFSECTDPGQVGNVGPFGGFVRGSKGEVIDCARGKAFDDHGLDCSRRSRRGRGLNRSRALPGGDLEGGGGKADVVSGHGIIAFGAGGSPGQSKRRFRERRGLEIVNVGRRNHVRSDAFVAGHAHEREKHRSRSTHDRAHEPAAPDRAPGKRAGRVANTGGGVH